MRRILLVLVDGLRPDYAEQWLSEGRLPHLRALLGTNGCRRGITAFPSTTSVAYLPFLTGCFPGRANVPSIRWLDRATYRGRWWRDRRSVRSYCGIQAGCLDGDINPASRTIFELIPESIGLFTPIARGLSPAQDPTRLSRKLWGAVAHYLQWHQPSDDAVARHLLATIGGDWRFCFAQFPAVDGYTHQLGPGAERVRRSLERVDRCLGQVVQALHQSGRMEDTLLLLVSDHGATPMHTHVDLADWFRARGVRTLAHPILWTRRPQVAVAVAGNASAMVYADPGGSATTRHPLSVFQRLGRRPAEDLLVSLASEPAVAFLAGEDESRSGFRLVGGTNGTDEAMISVQNGRIRYQRTSGDPLAIGEDGEDTGEGWLERTWNGPFPDAVAQIPSLFASSRTGDMVVVAGEGYDFRKRFEVPEHRAGHGSFLQAHMQIPIWSNRPLPTQILRSVDLFPSMLHWLGEPIPQGIDGRSLWLPS